MDKDSPRNVLYLSAEWEILIKESQISVTRFILHGETHNTWEVNTCIYLYTEIIFTCKYDDTIELDLNR